MTRGCLNLDNGQCSILVKAMTRTACITKRVMGFFGSKCVGFAPSKTPPCGAARLVLVAVDDDTVTVRVTVSISDCVGDAILIFAGDETIMKCDKYVRSYGFSLR